MFFTFIQDNQYLAIIADVKKSKKIEERGKFQDILYQTLQEVNDKYSDCIASNFTITLGDEFQGLLYSGKHVMEIIQYIKKETYPQKIRFGIGIGPITTNINHRTALGSDGPAYYKARESVENLKILEKKKEKAYGDIQININKNNYLQELSINTIFTLLYSIENNWTNKQREVISYMLFNKVNQTMVANHFNVTQSNIQQILFKSNYYTYKEAINSLINILSEVKYNE